MKKTATFPFWIFLLGMLVGYAAFSPFLGSSVLLADQNTGIVVTPLKGNTEKKTVPNGAQYVSALSFFVKSKSAAKLKTLGFFVTLGKSQDIERGHISVSGKFLREAPLLRDDGFLSWNDLGISLPKNSEVFVEIFLDMKSDLPPDSFYHVELRPEGFGLPASQVVISAPLSQGIGISSLAADLATISNSASALQIPKSTAKDQVIARFRVNAGSHDMIFRRIRLLNAEPIPTSRLSNIRLVSENLVKSIQAVTDAKSLDFVLKQTMIKKGKERSFSVIADISDAWKIEHIRFFLDTPSDLFLEDADFGSGVRVNNQFGSDSAWCLGAPSISCPAEGFRRRCSKDEMKAKVRDCR